MIAGARLEGQAVDHMRDVIARKGATSSSPSSHSVPSHFDIAENPPKPTTAPLAAVAWRNRRLLVSFMGRREEGPALESA